jgi:hypothetical protein
MKYQFFAPSAVSELMILIRTNFLQGYLVYARAVVTSTGSISPWKTLWSLQANMATSKGTSTFKQPAPPQPGRNPALISKVSTQQRRMHHMVEIDSATVWGSFLPIGYSGDSDQKN